MIDLINSLPSFVALAIVVLLSAGTTVLGLVLVRRFGPPHVMENHNEVAGFIYAVLGVVYAVVLAFVFIVVWEQYSDTGEVLEREASALASIFREVQIFQTPEQLELRKHIYLYTNAVVTDDWPEMVGGNKTGAQSARDEYNAIWKSLRAIKVTNQAEANWHAEMLHRLNDLAGNRRIRLSRIELETPAVLWALLILGGLVTVAYTYLYGVHNFKAQAAMAGSLAAVIAVTLFAIYAMQHPFRGGLALHPKSYQREITSFTRQFAYEHIPVPATASPAPAPAKETAH